jgi:ATP-dependent exoDNAse (exonuclease V) beta subunit
LAKKYDFRVKILEEPAIKDILKELLRESNNKIKPQVDILYSYVSGNKKMDVSDNYARALDLFNKKYIHYKRVNGLYDFTDYPLYLLDKLNQYDEIITSVDALFVDELQDVDEDQLNIFDKVLCNKKFYIGDARQCIYGFRGADMEAFKKLKNFDHKNLKYNYRSYQEIIDYANTMYEENLDRIS